MIEKSRNYDPVVDFWKWYQHRQHNPVANLALDKCEESARNREWTRFGYWHAVYLRERLSHPRTDRIH